MNAVEAGIDLIRRLPPSNVKENVDVIANMLSKNDPEDALDFRAAVDIPLVVIIPKDGSKAFLGCEYNREGLPESPDEVSYRSPWTNTFFPTEVKDGIKPADALRQLELKMANAMDIYRDLYYSTAGSSSCTSYSSTYLWEQDAQAFAGAVLFKKSMSLGRREQERSTILAAACNTWDALHVFEAQTSARTGSKVNYKLTSTVILSIKSEESEISLSGSLTRQVHIFF